MARKIIGMVVAVVMLFSVVALTGCNAKHEMPEGKYYPCDENGERLGWGGDYFLLVEKKEAQYFSSGLLSHKFKIVMEEGKMYFDEYIFTDFLSRRKKGKDARYEVNYDEESGILSGLFFDFIREE